MTRRQVPLVDVDGTRFHVVRLGPGPDRAPVVFLHGLVVDNISTFYYTLAPVAARDHDVICYDLRGHGYSDRPRQGYRIEDAVDDLVGILDALDISRPVHLVGYSFGGTVALAAARWRPERVASLVVIESEPASEAWRDEMVDNLTDIVAGLRDPEFQDYLATEAPRPLRRVASLCEELVTECSLPADFRASTTTSFDDLAGLHCPTLLLFGESSEILDVAFQLDDVLPHSELHLVPDCSHLVMLEAPDEVGKHVTDWLDRLTGLTEEPEAT